MAAAISPGGRLRPVALEGERRAEFTPDARTVPGLIAELATRLPHRPAAITDDETLTFADLDARATEVAAALHALGVRRGDAVAVWVPNQIEWLLCMTGASRLGAMVVPLNTWFKDDEIRYVLRHSEAVVLVAADRVRSQDLHEALGRICPAVTEGGHDQVRDPGLPALRHVVQLGPRRHPGATGWAEFLASSSDRGEVARAAEDVRPDDPHYLLYTSGSTAVPKAVPLLHGHCVANGHALGVRQGMTPSDRSWLVQPLFWALGAMNMLFSTWSHGAAVVLQRVFDAGEGLATIERHRATHTFAVGNISSALLAHPDFAAADLSSLVKGVSLFSEADRRAAHDGLGMRDFVSVYGSTETHGTCFAASWADPLEQRMVDNGPLMPGWEARLVVPGTDDEVDLADLTCGGDVAELTVRGRLAAGYWRAPEQTAAAFDADGWFHTGDLVRLQPGQRLVFVSRRTEMIKTGGINVAPAEVENLLVRHPGVRQAFVFGVPDAVRGERVVAVIDGPEVDTDDLRGWAAERLAGYKVPTIVLARDDAAIPRLATGKVAKRVLREQIATELGALNGDTAVSP